jgi:NADH-quinone oxidoreductase subunit K
MIITNLYYLILVTTFLYLIGAIGLILNRRNILIIIIAVELMLLAINLNFITFSIYLDDILGQMFVLFILTVAATESSIGLAILIVFFRIKKTILIENILTIKS